MSNFPIEASIVVLFDPSWSICEVQTPQNRKRRVYCQRPLLIVGNKDGAVMQSVSC